MHVRGCSRKSLMEWMKMANAHETTADLKRNWESDEDTVFFFFFFSFQITKPYNEKTDSPQGRFSSYSAAVEQLCGKSQYYFLTGNWNCFKNGWISCYVMWLRAEEQLLNWTLWWECSLSCCSQGQERTSTDLIHKHQSSHFIHKRALHVHFLELIT